MKIVGIIPVRYESKRFPGKALAILDGKTLLQHVYESVKKNKQIAEVYITTDNDLIVKNAKEFNAPVVLTPKECSNGSERAAVAVKDIDCDIAINIQADQPMLPKEILEEVIEPFYTQKELDITTPIFTLEKEEDIANPNIVKTIIDKNNYAIYFSRAFIPYIRNKRKNHKFYKHIGVYAFKKEFLLKYLELPKGVLEETEGLEQLRILENGYKIKTVIVKSNSISVDVKADLELVKAIIGTK